MTRDTRNRLLLGLAGLAVILSVLTLAWGPTPKRQVPATWGSGEDVSLSGSLQEEAFPLTRSANVLPSENPARLCGKVLDEIYSVPLVAWVTASSGEGVYSSASGGGFALEGHRAPLTWVKASAPGYDAKELPGSDIVAGKEVIIRLRPNAFAKVIVQDEGGNPIRSAPVKWAAEEPATLQEHVSSWIHSRPAAQGEIVSTLTDAQGRSALAIGRISRVEVSDPRTGLKTNIRIRPGEERVLVLSSGMIRLRIADQANTPLPGVSLMWWLPLLDGSTASEVITDSDGVVHLPSVSFPVLLRSAGGQMWQKQWTALTPGVSIVGIGGKLRSVIRVDQAVDLASQLEVRVAECGGELRLVNGDTGAPVSGLARLVGVRKETTENEVKRPSGATVNMPFDETDDVWGTYLVENGVLDVPCTLLDLAGLAIGQQERQVALAVRGFVPVRIWPRDMPWNSTDAPLNVPLTPAAQRTLRVVYADEYPCREAVRVYCPSLDSIVWRGEGKDNGIQGPFEWGGSDLLLCVGGDESWSVKVPLSSLSTQEIVDVILPTRTGALLVGDVPAGAEASSLIAKLGVGMVGTTFRPTRISSTECRFDALPAGHYCVGPASWVAGAELQSVGQKLGSLDLKPNPSRVWVEPGKTTRLSWSTAWQAGRRIEGCITANGHKPKGLFLVPLYGPIGSRAEEGAGGTPRIVFGRRSPTIQLDEDGCYLISEHDPLPRLLAVCALDDSLWGSVQGLHVLQTLLAGESVNLELGSITFIDEGRSPGEDRRVKYCLTGESRRYPVNSFHECSENTWYGGSTLHLENVPVEVGVVTVGRVNIPVHIRSGDTTVIKMNGDTLLEGHQDR